MLGIISVYKILHDASRFEEVDSLPVRKRISESGNAAIGVYSTEPRFLLCVLADVDLVDFVGETVEGISG
jgi:hypothetical protein